MESNMDKLLPEKVFLLMIREYLKPRKGGEPDLGLAVEAIEARLGALGHDGEKGDA
jgi:hypothetical protein